MSLIINGLDMPNDCCQCKLARYDDYENETFCPFTEVMCLSIGRQDNCPLEELPETHDKRTETHACDCIERQSAIDAVRKNTFRLTFAEEQGCEGHVAWSGEAVYSDVIEGALLELPSAQPELIRCKDCVYRSIIPGSDQHYWCNQWYASVFDGNGYCSRGRREDGQAD